MADEIVVIEYGPAGREAGRDALVPGPVRTPHIHMVEAGGAFRERHLRFGDYLRENGSAAAEYAALKKALARQHAGQREAYTSGKTAFIEAALQASSR